MPKDFLDGDHSFKKWFKIMWENHYIQIFIVAFGVTIYELCTFQNIVDSVANADGIAGIIMSGMGVLIAPVLTIVVAYKGFYQFWNDLKNGRSR